MRVHDSQAYRKMGVTKERISRLLELGEILLSIQTGFSLVNAAVVRAVLESISGLEPSSVIAEPRYLKLVTISSSCPFPDVVFPPLPLSVLSSSPLSLCLAQWFWPDLMNGKHDHTTAVCVSLRSSGGLRVVQLPAGSWHGFPRW